MNEGHTAGYIAAAPPLQPALNGLGDRPLSVGEELVADERPRPSTSLQQYGNVHWNDMQELPAAGSSTGTVLSAPAGSTMFMKKSRESSNDSEGDSDREMAEEDGNRQAFPTAKSKRISWDSKGKSPERRTDNGFEESIPQDGSFRSRLDSHATVVSPQRMSWQSYDSNSLPRLYPRRNASAGGNDSKESPNSTISKRRKRRSNTWNALAGPSALNNGRNRDTSRYSSTDGEEDGPVNRSHSSSPRRSLSPSPTLDQRAKRSHLPRSASEVISSSSQNTARYGSKSGRKPLSGRSDSPENQAYSRSRSSGDVLAEYPVSRTNSSNNFSGFPPQLVPPLRPRSSGLYMRTRQPSASQLVTSTSIDPEAQYAVVAPSQPRKRAKSNLLNTPDLGARRPSSFQPVTAPVGRTFSSSTPRRRTGSSVSRNVFPTVDSPSSARETGETTQEDRVFAGDGGASSAMNGSPVSGRLPSSKSRPFSIAGLMAQEGASAAPLDVTSLQDLLKQVDVKGALALVKEVQANADPGNQHTRRGSVASPYSPKQTPLVKVVSKPSDTPGRPTSQDYAEPRSLSSQPSAVSMQGSSTVGPTVPLLPASTTTRTLADRRRSVQLPQNVNDATAGLSNVNGLESKRKRRLSIASFRAPAREKKTKEKELSRQDGAAADDPNVILEKVSPAVFAFVSQVKSELETRYLPVYTALASGSPPPNPAEVARWRFRKNEIGRRRRLLEGQHDSLQPRSLRSSLADAATGYPERSASPSLVDQLRAKGYRHPVWEVYPRDFSNFVNAKGAILEEPANLVGAEGDVFRQAVLPSSRMSQRPHYHRHASSDVSLRSLGSIREGQAIDGIAGDRHKNGSYLRGPFGRKASVGSSTFSFSQSGRSGRSTSLTQDEALALASSPRSLQSSLGDSSPRKPAGHSRYNEVPQSSSVDPNELIRTAAVNAHPTSPISPARSLPTSPSRGHRQRLADRFKLHSKADKGETLYNLSSFRQGDSEVPRQSLMASLTLPSDTEPTMPSIYGSTKTVSKPTLSRHSSHSSSMVNLSRILGTRRNNRNGNETDGYKSTDNEEATDTSFGPRMGRRTRWRASMPIMQGTAPPRIVHDEESGLEDLASIAQTEDAEDDDIFHKVPVTIEVVDVGDEDLRKADGLLNELHQSLLRFQNLAPPLPGKLQTYVEEFYTLDTQRQLKGQLASIQIEDPPPLPDDVLAGLDADRPTPIGRRTSSRSGLDESDQEEGRVSPSTIPDSPPIDEHLSNSNEAPLSPATLKRTPHLDRVSMELASASRALDAARSEVRKARKGQEATSTRSQALSVVLKSAMAVYSSDIATMEPPLSERVMQLNKRLQRSGHIWDNLAGPVESILKALFFYARVVAG